MERVARIQTFARIGYLARAIVYFLIGYLTLATNKAEGTASVLADIRELPLGAPLLLITAVGLFGYGVFRLYDAAADLQDDGTHAKGLAKRLGHAASGIAHLILCFLATRIALAGGGSGNGGTEAAQSILSLPGGVAVLVVAGVGFFGAALNQAVKAATGKFMDLLDPEAPGWAEALGRIGYAARAAVFGALGWQVLDFALGGTRDTLSFQAALDALRDMGALYTAVAVGLLVFGLFSLVMARYRTIRGTHLIERIRSGAEGFL